MLILILVYEGAKTCIRLFPRSTTYTFPDESIAIPVGSSNCPSPVPSVPHFVINFPFLSNFWIRLLPSSTTKIFPEVSTARLAGLINCPFPLPDVPHLVKNYHC